MSPKWLCISLHYLYTRITLSTVPSAPHSSQLDNLQTHSILRRVTYVSLLQLFLCTPHCKQWLHLWGAQSGSVKHTISYSHHTRRQEQEIHFQIQEKIVVVTWYKQYCIFVVEQFVAMSSQNMWLSTSVWQNSIVLIMSADSEVSLTRSLRKIHWVYPVW